MRLTDLVEGHWYVDRRDGELVRFEHIARDPDHSRDHVIYTRVGQKLVLPATVWLSRHVLPGEWNREEPVDVVVPPAPDDWRCLDCRGNREYHDDKIARYGRCYWGG